MKPLDLFGNDTPINDSYRKPKPLLQGHADLPGSGPEGMTCKQCDHYAIKRMGGTYRKCRLMQDNWTNGKSTDIKAGDSSCSKFELKGCDNDLQALQRQGGMARH